MPVPRASSVCSEQGKDHGRRSQSHFCPCVLFPAAEMCSCRSTSLQLRLTTSQLQKAHPYRGTDPGPTQSREGVFSPTAAGISMLTRSPAETHPCERCRTDQGSVYCQYLSRTRKSRSPGSVRWDLSGTPRVVPTKTQPSQNQGGGEGLYIGITEAFEPTNTATNQRFLLTIIHSITRIVFCGQKEAVSANLTFPG